MNAWIHLTSQLQHIFYCLQPFPPALNHHLTSFFFCVLANGHQLLLWLILHSLFHSWPWSLSQFTMPGHTKTSLHMKSCLPNPCLLFLVAPQLTTAGLSSGGEGFSAISWFGGDAQRLSQPFFPTNPNPPALEHNWAAPIAEDIPVVHPKESEIGLLRASEAQAHQSELSTSHRVKTVRIIIHTIELS